MIETIKDLSGRSGPMWCLLRFRGQLVCLFAFLALGFIAGAPVHASDVSPSAHSISTLPITIADFDGDHRPDVASVQGHQNRTASTEDYWIGLRLSATGKKYIRFTAPKGGLLVEARDVNGDNAVDLVLATAWLDRPVAVLLNDGHGNFSRSDASVFPAAFHKSGSGWTSQGVDYALAVGLPQTPSCGELSPDALAGTLPAINGRLQNHDQKFALAVRCLLNSGRSPPSEFSL
jgi:hypothetical protein